MDVQTRTTSSLVAQIESYLGTTQRVLKDKYAIEEAKKLVPIADLVQNNLDVLEGDYQDNLLPLVVRWFSSDFFSWFTVPNCEICDQKLESDSNYVNEEGLQVERYKCSRDSCDFTYDFIRHNDPAILLTTRRGRCGEWANCFMIILIALDYDARLVLDITDHVWNEVWSNSKQRWVHVDPCEGVVDAPLLYEVGWSKKLIYCFAFGQHEAIDVTPRYALDFKLTKARRKDLDDRKIRFHLGIWTFDLLNANITDPKIREAILERRDREFTQLREFEEEPRKAFDVKEYSMRKTGSLSWRIQRGEYKPQSKSGFVISVNESSSSNNESSSDNSLFTLTYNCDKNKYSSSMKQYSGDGGWSSITHLYENLDHKYERDWRTSYISRYETCSYLIKGKIQWRFDLSSLEERWHKLEIYLSGKVYPNTTITIRLGHLEKNDLENEIQVTILELNKLNILHRKTFKPNATVFDLTAELSGGDAKDDVSWQKPQLFRQTKGLNAHENGLVMKVY